MNIFTDQIEFHIQSDIIKAFRDGNHKSAMSSVPKVLDALYAAIPDNKRISHGRYYTIKVMVEYLWEELPQKGISLFEFGSKLYDLSEEYRARGVALGLLSYHGLEDHSKVLPYFESAATDEPWELREFAAGFFQKIVREKPEQVKSYLLTLVQDEDPKLRRFVSEMLRPVVDNRWLNNEPEYSLSILRHLFRESAPYPRKSVGNNLSDLARRNPELVYDLVEELVGMEDKHALWIATRACRNLVKKEPIRVMDILGVDEYKYKQRIHRRSE